MACNADRIESYAISRTLSDLPACISVSRSVSLRVVCIQVIDAAAGDRSDQDERRLPRRQALPVAVASVALPVAAASLALAAAPLLRRLPDRLLPPGAVSRVRPMLPGAMGRAMRIRRPPELLPLDAGEPLSPADEDMNNPTGAVISAATAEGDGALAAVECALAVPAAVPS